MDDNNPTWQTVALKLIAWLTLVTALGMNYLQSRENHKTLTKNTEVLDEHTVTLDKAAVSASKAEVVATKAAVIGEKNHEQLTQIRSDMTENPPVKSIPLPLPNPK